MFVFSFVFIIYIIITYNIYNNNILLGSVKCFDKESYKTCLYNNVYFFNGNWHIYSANFIHMNVCVNIFARKLGLCWKMKYLLYDKYKNNEIYIHKIYSDISIPFKLTYNINYGHAFWDDLYSIYTSMVKIGFKSKNFNLIIQDTFKNTRYLKDIYSVLEKFSKGKNIFTNDLKNKIILFKRIIVGSSHQCQRCVTTDYSLKYSREYNITRILRDRMYEVYNIKPLYKHPFDGIIVHNKRYSNYEKSILKRVIKYFNNNKEIKLRYIDFSNIKGFYKQLKILSTVHIYISGPGTGLLNFPFIADPGVVIHLGHIHFGCPQYLEQYMLEGSPHIKAFYYSSRLRKKNMSFDYTIHLITKGIEYIKNNRIIYVKRTENLNGEGKLFIRICKEYKEICDKLIKRYDWAYGRCRGIWAENVVYFPSVYKYVPQLKNAVISINESYNLGCKVGINHSNQNQWC